MAFSSETIGIFKNSEKRISWIKTTTLILGAGVVAGIIGYLTHSYITSLIAGIAGGLVALWLNRVSGGKDEISPAAHQEKPEPPKDTVPKTEDAARILEGLIYLNQKAREAGLSGQILSQLEGIIDILIELIPLMEDRYPGDELTWETKRMAVHHLPRILEPFIKLTEADRASQESQFLQSLAAIKIELSEISDLASRDQVGEFSRKAKAVSLKYEQGPVN